MRLPSRPSFSVLLPLLELAVWVALIIVPSSLEFLDLEGTARGAAVARIEAGELNVTIPRSEFLPFAVEMATTESAPWIAGANIPGILGEALVSLPTSWPQSWRPKQMDIHAWRGVVFPLFCLPAWWLVGMGLDSLLGLRRLRLPALLTGSVLCGLFAVVFIGFAVMSSAEPGDVIYSLWGTGFWAVLFGVLPVVWFRQWRGSRVSHEVAKEEDV